MRVATAVQTYGYWLVFAPLVLLFQAMPDRDTRTRVVPA